MLAEVTDLTERLADPERRPWFIVAGAAAAAAVLLAVGRRVVVGGRRRGRRAPEEWLGEDLTEYPPPPAKADRRMLRVQGLNARVRLAVVAPPGQGEPPEIDAIPALLDRVLPGLGRLAASDRPRLKVWPAQLSMNGFALKFHRLTDTGDPPGADSRWVLLAGPARAGTRTVLLGLALWAEESSALGKIDLRPEDWSRYLRID